MTSNRPLSACATRLILLIGLATWAGGALAQSSGDDATRATARQLGEEGLEAYWAKEYATADLKLDRAYRLFATPTLGLYSARARFELGHWVEAAERYRDTARTSVAVGDSAAQKKAQDDAALELNALRPRIPHLTILLENEVPNPVAIRLDGVEVPRAMIGLARPTNPGSHRLIATRGTQHFERSVNLTERAAASISIDLGRAEFAAPARPATPSPAAAQPRARAVTQAQRPAVAPSDLWIGDTLNSTQTIDNAAAPRRSAQPASMVTASPGRAATASPAATQQRARSLAPTQNPAAAPSDAWIGNSLNSSQTIDSAASLIRRVNAVKLDTAAPPRPVTSPAPATQTRTVTPTQGPTASPWDAWIGNTLPSSETADDAASRRLSPRPVGVAIPAPSKPVTTPPAATQPRTRATTPAPLPAASP